MSAPKQYRKKPVVIEAMQFEPFDGRNGREVSEWVGDAFVGSRSHKDGRFFQLSIRTLEGTMTALPGDWLIKGVAGEVYPCKPDIFAATYEPVLCGGTCETRTAGVIGCGLNAGHDGPCNFDWAAS